MRRRCRWASAAVVAAVALTTAGCARTPAPPSGSEAPSLTVHGRVIPFAGLQRWTLASVPDRGSTRLTVFAVGTDRGGGPCGPPVVRLSAQESASTVRVSVADYQEPVGATTACSAIGYIGGPQRVVLRRAIAGRRVVDASTGRAATLLVAADYPRLATPAGFTAQPFGQLAGGSRATQTWQEQHGTGRLSLMTTSPAATREQGAYGRIVRQFALHGSPAAIYRDGSGRSAQWQVQWTPNARQTITLVLGGSTGRRWTADDAERLARRVDGYRTEATGRLPLPTTPGTAVAAYSSVDGPVRHAPNMWKSSGVYVGVRCEGNGTVSVSLRGSTRRFACGTTAARHVFRSDGAPDDTFFLDVGAAEGVRWAVTLARASLDGS